MKLTLLIRYTEQDIHDTIRLTSNRSCLQRARWIWIISTTAILMGIVFRLGWNAETLILAIIAFLPYPYLIFDTYFASGIFAKSYFAKSKEFQDVFKIEMSEDGVQVTDSRARANRPWSDFIRVIRNRRIILLCFPVNRCYIIPVDSFTSQEQYQEFQSLIETYLSHRTS